MTGDREDEFIGGGSCKFSWISIPNLHATIERKRRRRSDTLLIRRWLYVYANEGITGETEEYHGPLCLIMSMIIRRISMGMWEGFNVAEWVFSVEDDK